LLPVEIMRFAIALLLTCVTAHAATLPAGFSETTIASGLSNPTAMAMAPDGRIFVCQQGGALRVIKNNTLLTTPFVTLTVDSTGERGLLGVAFDPDFLTNRYVYLYYTATSPVHNRISRFTANGDVVAAGSEVILMDLENLSATNHNGGAIHFGKDGKLYVAVGENAVPSNSQTLNNRLGKMLRLNKDGTIPTDNPFYNTASGNNRAIWTLGLRNPFTFNVHPLSGRLFINDVGQSAWEEINDGIAGANYGWPTTEGPTTNPQFTGPIHHYANSNAVECAIAGGAFYAPEVRQYPQAYVESYFFADLCGGWIRRLDQQNASHGFATAVSNPVDLLVGHDGSLYYLARGGGVLRRVRWNAHLEGDVNGDGSVTNADLLYLANHLHGGGPAPVQGGDVDNNGTVNGSDLAYLANYLLGRGTTPV
jgi:glucose/arabinose dehydrogenase